MTEIKFQKYKTRNPGYHWEQISKSLRKRNVYVIARYNLILDLIANEIKNKKILDVGCGDGALTYLLAKRGANVIGIDNSKETIKFAKERCGNFKNLDFQIASVYELPFGNKNFDYVISSEIIEHLEYPEKMLSEINRIWNQHGKVIITTPIKFTQKPFDKMHYQEFFEEDLKTLLGDYFPENKIKIIKSHPLFWLEFYNRTILGHSLNKIFLNFLDLFFGFNPFQNTGRWKHYTLQIAIITK